MRNGTDAFSALQRDLKIAGKQDVEKDLYKGMTKIFFQNISIRGCIYTAVLELRFCLAFSRHLSIPWGMYYKTFCGNIFGVIE